MSTIGDEIICSFCGSVTPSYQLVSQIPNSKVDQRFILNEILSVDGVLLKPTDFVCFDHEDTRLASNSGVNCGTSPTRLPSLIIIRLALTKSRAVQDVVLKILLDILLYIKWAWS